MKYSIIIPVYLRDSKRLDDIAKCVESVRKYSSDYELILIDDGSPEDALLYELIDEYSEFHPDVYIRHQNNKGVAPSWNDGLRIARGDYIVVLNDDTEVCADWLEKMSGVFENDRSKKIAVVGPAVEHLPNDSNMPAYQWFPGSCFMISRKTIKRVGYFDEQFAPFFFEETDYWTKIMQCGYQMARVLNVFIQHKEGQTVKDLSKNEIYQTNLLKFIKKHNFDPIPVFCGGDPLPK